jgi:cytochrome c peroxidase
MTRAIFIILAAAALILAADPAFAQSLSPKEQLGKELFFDNISQPSKSMSCASCHDPKVGWVGAVAGVNLHGAVYPGAVPTRFGNRKPPTSAYSTYAPIFKYDKKADEFIGGNFWDGRATGWKLGNPAADQALGPFLNPVEQNMPSARAVCQHVANSKYAKLFEQVWGKGRLDCSQKGYKATYDRIGLSIAAYEGSTEVSPFSSKFDAYWAECLKAKNKAEACGLGGAGKKSKVDPRNILTEQEYLGLTEFGEYCSACHISHIAGPNGKPPLFTDFKFDNIGVPKNPENPFYRMDKVFLDDGTPINPLGAKWVDKGLGDFLRTTQWAKMAAAHDGKFRTPTVRNVDKRPGDGFAKAYMHNGALKSLEEVVLFYNTRDEQSAKWPPPEHPGNLNAEMFNGKPLGKLGLSKAEEAAIVAFMKTLTDGWTPPTK